MVQHTLPREDKVCIIKTLLGKVTEKSIKVELIEK